MVILRKRINLNLTRKGSICLCLPRRLYELVIIHYEMNGSFADNFVLSVMNELRMSVFLSVPTEEKGFSDAAIILHSRYSFVPQLSGLN